MIKTALILSLTTVMLSGGFISNFSFAYGGDSDKIDKNFIRDDKKEVVLDIKNKKLYYDVKSSQEMSYTDALNYCKEMDYLGYKDWEVPTKDELRSLLELSRTHISIKHAFKNVQQGIDLLLFLVQLFTRSQPARFQGRTMCFFTPVMLYSIFTHLSPAFIYKYRFHSHLPVLYADDRCFQVRSIYCL